MKTDREKHLAVLARHQELARKIARGFVLCLLLVVGLWLALSIFQQEPEPETPRWPTSYKSTYDSKAAEPVDSFTGGELVFNADTGSIVITANGTAGDAIVITSTGSGGGIDLTWDVEESQ